jgi:hypothetical protein
MQPKRYNHTRKRDKKKGWWYKVNKKYANPGTFSPAPDQPGQTVCCGDTDNEGNDHHQYTNKHGVSKEDQEIGVVKEQLQVRKSRR